MRQLAGMVVLIWAVATPAGAEHDTVRDAVLNGLFGAVRGEVTVEQVSEAADEPVSIHGLRIVDAENRPVLFIDRLNLEATGAELRARPLAVGRMQAVGPQFFVELGEGEMPLVAALRGWFFQFAAGKRVEEFVGSFRDGHVHIVDVEAERQWFLSSLEFSALPNENDPSQRDIVSSGVLAMHGVEWDLRCRYEPDEKSITIQRLQVLHDPTGSLMDIAGKLGDLGLSAVLELEGHWSAHWPSVEELLAQHEIFVVLRGGERQPVRIRCEVGDMIGRLTGLADTVRQAEQLAQQWTGGLFGRTPEKPPAQEEPAEEESALPVRDWHWMDAIEVETSYGWEHAEWQGFVAAPTQVPVIFKHGSVEVGPTSVGMNGGRFMAAARIDLTEDDPAVELPETWLLKGIILTPEVCAGLLAYVAPVVADATNVEGRISVGLRGGRIPLKRPKDAELKGDLVVDSVQMDLSPAFGRWARLLRAVSRIRLIDESVTHFEMAEQTIQHEGFGFVLGDSQMYTRGAVQLDRRLDITVNVRLGLSFLPDGPIGRRLKGTEIQANISGTLDKPELGELPLPLGDRPAGRLLQQLLE